MLRFLGCQGGQCLAFWESDGFSVAYSRYRVHFWAGSYRRCVRVLGLYGLAIACNISCVMDPPVLIPRDAHICNTDPCPKHDVISQTRLPTLQHKASNVDVQCCNGSDNPQAVTVRIRPCVDLNIGAQPCERVSVFRDFNKTLEKIVGASNPWCFSMRAARLQKRSMGIFFSGIFLEMICYFPPPDLDLQKH